MKSTRKTSVPKIDSILSRNRGDWSAVSSVPRESPVRGVFETGLHEKEDDWSDRFGVNEKSTDSTRALPFHHPGPKIRVRLGIKLVFPGGERESQTYSVHKFLSVQVFKQRLGNDLMKTTYPISLFVSPNWQLLNHTGCVNDQVYPGTNTPCPYLDQGSTVRVEWGDRKVSLVGDTVSPPKRPTRGGEKRNPTLTSPEERLKGMKGISAGPVKWYSSDRPRATTQLMEVDDPDKQIQLKRKRGVDHQAILKSQIAERPTPLKRKNRKGKPDLSPENVVDNQRRRIIARDPSPNSEHNNNEDIVMIVKIRRNALDDSQQAFVDFKFAENRGDTGPFKMGVTLDQLMNYYHQWNTDPDTTSSDSDCEERGKDEEENSSSSDDDDGDSDGAKSEEGETKGDHKEEIKEGQDSNMGNSPEEISNDKNIERTAPEPGGNIDDLVALPDCKYRFHKEQLVYYWDCSKKTHWVGVIRLIREPHPAEGSDNIVRYWIEPEGEDNYQLPCLLVHEKDIRPLELALWDNAKRSTTRATCLPVHESPLLPLNCVGIDTCSALSVSSEKSDFPFLDESHDAKQSISLRGIGGEHASVGGRGPMLISALDNQGRTVYMVDPLGVYLPKSSSVQLRILGQQRMKSFGFNLMQDLDGDGKDYLVYKPPGGSNRNISMIPLTTKDGILMLKTRHLDFTKKHKVMVDEYIKSLCTNGIGSEMDYLFHFETNKSCPVLIMNEASLDDKEKRRLDHWRYAHRSSDGSRHDERCPACEQAKHKSGSFKRNKEYLGTGIPTLTVYWRLYCDSYGGQRSMGEVSYQGAKGGFVFVCPVSGRIKVKLYASTKQYPAILYQVLQEVESEGYAVREIYVDTYIVNISAAAEDVAAMYKVRIVPISSGTPQELAYAERAVQTLAQMSRALMAGAPHLPQEMWGCSDIYAAYLHLTLPQKSKDMMSPYEKTTGRSPYLEAMFIKVFGCACQYEPHGGAEHKTQERIKNVVGMVCRNSVAYGSDTQTK